jgi:TolB-like protein/Tfp pilus assembly protein PilF
VPESAGPPVSAPAAPAPVTPPPAPRAVRWPRVLAAGALLLVVVAGLSLGLRERGVAASTEKTVAVLPFANLSDESDSAHFTDGLHDSILTHLALIQDLSVISRTSVMQYRNGDRNLRQIARALGVAHIVEGSVQRAGNRLLVTAQLIDTRTDSHLWAGQFDRSLSDVFAVQAGIAQQIAGAVHARLTPEERHRIERTPTQSVQAYELYLRALEVERRSKAGRADVEAAIAQVEQAIALDPQFALAYALLSGLHDSLYWSGQDATEVRRDRVRDAAQTALRLAPDLPEAHIAMGRYLYHGTRDYAAAIAALERAHTLAPGNAQVPFWLGAIYRRQGRWEEAVHSLERAIERDPRNEQVLTEHAFTLTSLRRYADADLVYARLEAFAARPETIRLKRGTLQWIWRGDLDAFDRVLAAFPDSAQAGCHIAFARWELHVARRAFDTAADEVMACDDGPALASDAGAVPKTFFAAAARMWNGDEAQALALFAQARDTLDARLRERSGESGARVALALSQLALGERDAAFAQVQRALDDMPLSMDAVSGASVASLAAGFYALAGETERAFELLERSLATPAGEHAASARMNPVFDSLRADPRFDALLARYGGDGASP